MAEATSPEPTSETTSTTTTTRRSSTPATTATAEAPTTDKPSQAELDAAALDREKAMARSRGAPEDELRDWESKLIWVHSNRQDDRTVIYEPDPLHPGGQAFVGGEGPDHVYRTAAIEALLQSGELIEVPEPLRTIKDEMGEEIPNPFYPDQNYTQGGDVPANMPGQPVQLGRKLNPNLWDEQTMADVKRRQAYMPSSRPVPPGGIVPPPPPR